jgi:hypothetical protein
MHELWGVIKLNMFVLESHMEDESVDSWMLVRVHQVMMF